MKKKEFTVFLDSEIESLRNEIQRPGWTTWALTGALAALIWILISLVEQGNFSLRAVASLLLVISFLWYSCPVIKDRISPSLSSQQSRDHLIPAHLISANISGIILMVAQLVFLTIVIHRFSLELGSIVTSISFVAVSILLLGALGAVVFVTARFPVPFSPRPRIYNTVVLVICSVLLLLPVWYHIRWLWISPGGATVYDVRLALVIAAIFYLCYKLISVPRGALTLDLLTTIRRELVLGRIELGTAIQQVDIALTGMRASDLLEGYVTKLLSLYRDASIALSKSTSCLDQLERLHSETKEKPSPEQPTSVHQLLLILASSIDKVHDIITTDIPRAYKPIDLRVMLLASMGFLKSSDDLQDLEQKLKTAQTDLQEQTQEFRAKYDEIRKTIQLDEPQMA